MKEGAALDLRSPQVQPGFMLVEQLTAPCWSPLASEAH